MFLRDLHTGEIRKYGENHHDSLIIANKRNWMSMTRSKNKDIAYQDKLSEMICDLTGKK